MVYFRIDLRRVDVHYKFDRPLDTTLLDSVSGDLQRRSKLHRYMPPALHTGSPAHAVQKHKPLAKLLAFDDVLKSFDFDSNFFQPT